MRLEKIRLAGFKSFVDPTTLVLPGRLIGIVGPNGCGKSNLIDAVRFVIGESSAKHLRGSAMSDVVFNGAAGRAPASLATVELIFDNSDGRAGGECANYAQISVKRQVSREGQSQYFLNGSRCRRRDIMDLFLGTGLGPRSYAIIEQGMVSRFIEARPDDLRLFIEEAAGLSKYKERRRETELKLEHTRANLERVADVRAELQTQVNRLARQAKKAEKFRDLARQIHICQHQLLALQWRVADDEYRRTQARLAERERDLKQHEAAWRQAEAEASAARERVDRLEKQLQQWQAKRYQLDADIGHSEQTVKHLEEKKAQRRQTLEEWRRELERTRAALAQDRQQLEELARQRHQLETELEEARKQAHADTERQRQTEAEWQEARRRFAQLRDRQRQYRHEAQLAESETGHLQRQQAQLQKRLQQLDAQREALEQAQGRFDAAAWQQRLDQAQSAHRQCRQQLAQLAAEIQSLEQQREQQRRELARLERESHRIQGRISALETLQRHALGKDQKALQDWLTRQGWQELPRLGETLEVEPGWEQALEAALGHWLEALCHESLPMPPETPPASLSLLATATAAPPQPDTLAAKILKGPVPAFLNRFRCCADLATALARRDRLAPHECWITPAGEQVGPDHCHLPRPADEEAGVLARQKTLRELRDRLGRLQRQHRSVQAELTRLQETLQTHTRQQETLQARERDQHAALARLQAEHQAAQRQHRETGQRLEQLARERQETERESSRIDAKLASLDRRIATLHQQTTELTDQIQGHEARLDRCRQHHETAAAQARHSREQVTRLEAALEHAKRTADLLAGQLQRGDRQCRELSQRLAEAEARQDAEAEPLARAHEQLEALRARRPELEAALAACRRELEQAVETLRTLEGRRRQQEQARDQARQQVEQARLAAEAARVRFDAARAQVTDADVELAPLLETLPPEADPAVWQQRLKQLERDQDRLGDVNLAAIEEHKTHRERLDFIDSQYQDLEAALALLEKAIRTIDRETRTRFGETFTAVDGHFRQRFPALFGGGEARLELTGDDPLEAGVRIVARPPGKRNSSIHLLSGGEKALTAVALVFSFFELNPAPFCILDEVDAPLDDANVGRFCQLLQSMAERVQFLFITHNKITMEIADQLIGVTMREPGVSRIVSVDLKRAAEMAA
ncbi:chromosome segregation protein [Methylomarinovum caldicuralii]|uniref:Chromosome partition protein Smc n=1 Tax=Methylomarinovum caldicuralii TaxID=438856 RepID=A0AAU9CE07_9GAMM|nr:chromosome segregation protein SMC [Methylomarinovum caldicuralii]BCX81215.1 chromosome segregation protein [Methylomarinovum caldicuralii]